MDDDNEDMEVNIAASGGGGGRGGGRGSGRGSGRGAGRGGGVFGAQLQQQELLLQREEQLKALAEQLAKEKEKNRPKTSFEQRKERVEQDYPLHHALNNFNLVYDDMDNFKRDLISTRNTALGLVGTIETLVFGLEKWQKIEEKDVVDDDKRVVTYGYINELDGKKKLLIDAANKVIINKEIRIKLEAVVDRAKQLQNEITAYKDRNGLYSTVPIDYPDKYGSALTGDLTKKVISELGNGGGPSGVDSTVVGPTPMTTRKRNFDR